jgi:polyisoprenoid-binding protein YceI
MAPSGQLTASALQELLQGATLAGNWTLDESKSTIGLKSKSMWGMVPVKGVFRQVTGNGTVSPAGEVSGTISVAAESVDTKNKKRDTHLRSADFFDSGTYPHITFTVERVSPASEGVTVAGRLTVHGRTMPISFPAVVSVLGGDEVQLDGEVQVNRADFGLTWNKMGMTSMINTITVHAVFGKR